MTMPSRVAGKGPAAPAGSSLWVESTCERGETAEEEGVTWASAPPANMMSVAPRRIISMRVADGLCARSAGGDDGRQGSQATLVQPDVEGRHVGQRLQRRVRGGAYHPDGAQPADRLDQQLDAADSRAQDHADALGVFVRPVRSPASMAASRPATILASCEQRATRRLPWDPGGIRRRNPFTSAAMRAGRGWDRKRCHHGHARTTGHQGLPRSRGRCCRPVTARPYPSPPPAVARMSFSTPQG